MLPLQQIFPEWKDFPKGLHVLVVDEDQQVLDDLKCKLEAYEYIVTAVSYEHDALAALQDRNYSFHVAVVEATTSEKLDGFKIVGAARHLPTIMMSNTEDLAVMMQSIEAGASEFLQKPLSGENLKNIWQHVVRKALCTGELVLPKFVSQTDGASPGSASVKKESLEHVKSELSSSEVPEAEYFLHGHDSLLSGEELELESDSVSRSARFPGPSTPQLKQASRLSAQEDNPDESPLSHDVACMKAEVGDEICSEFDECGSYLEIKIEEENGDRDFAIPNQYLNADSERDALLCKDFENLESELCADMQFNGNLDLDNPGGDILLSNDFVPEDALLSIDMDDCFFDELTGDDAVELNLDCLGDEDLQEADEEALLLAEVAKAEGEMLFVDNGGDLKVAGENRSANGCVKVVGTKSLRNEYESNGKSCKISQSKRKMKVDWTPELHRRFVQAVEQLGVDKAIPSRILELMEVQCLTRHNIASHLQKYRSHKKHLLAREAEAVSWNHRRGSAVSRPPPTQPRPIATSGAPLHVWGHPTLDPFWHASFWPQHPASACVDAWGHPAPGTPFYRQPIMQRLPLAPMPGVANMAVPLHPPVPNISVGDGKIPPFHPPKETVDAAISEVLRNPFTPLPLGLKPPSLESVITELQSQGVKTAPPIGS